jgi:hypothetical protein
MRARLSDGDTQVGTMDFHKVIATTETTGRSETLINTGYAEERAFYHAIIEALHGAVVVNSPLVRSR